MVCRECRFTLHMGHHGDDSPSRCVVCRLPIAEGSMTCGPQHHETFVTWLEREFGAYKKVVRLTTGETFLVPIRDIVEKGVNEQDLDSYPRLKEAL